MKIVLFLLGILALMSGALAIALAEAVTHNVMHELIGVLLVIAALLGLGFATVIDRLERGPIVRAPGPLGLK